MTTGKIPAKKAGKLLATPGTPKDAKTVSASALVDAKTNQTKPPKNTKKK